MIFGKDSRLHSRPGLEPQEIKSSGRISGSGFRFLPVLHKGNQSSCPEEADKIRELVAEIVGSKATWIDREGKEAMVGLNDILIIAPTRRLRFGPDERSTEDRDYSGLSFVQIAIPGHAGVDRGAPSSLALALRQDHAEMIGISWLAVGSHVIHVCAARRVTSASHQTNCCSENERSQHCTPHEQPRWYRSGN
jgi:hypothetical protein